MQGPSDEPLHAHALAHRNAQGLRALEKGNLSQAQRLFQEAHLLAPHDGRVLVNLGFSFHARNQPQAEERCCRLALKSGDVNAYRSASKNLAFLHLKQGNLSTGWFWYAQQLLEPSLIRHQWTGLDAPVPHPLLVWNDMGQGDAIQFCRYLPPLIAAGYHIRLAVQPAMIPLLSTSLPVAAPQRCADALGGVGAPSG